MQNSVSSPHVSSITSRLYGIGGGIIIICFLISVWSWAKKRSTIEVGHRLTADLRIISYLFFLIAAWGLCGLLGSPLFGLRLCITACIPERSFIDADVDLDIGILKELKFIEGTIRVRMLY